MSISTRREFLAVAGFGTMRLFSSSNLRAYPRREKHFQVMFVYAGTYTTGKSEGIYLYKMNLTSGELQHLGTTKGVVNPSFLAFDPHRCYLYAVNEVTEFGGKPGGAVSAFSV